jgi:hypothetical protein
VSKAGEGLIKQVLVGTYSTRAKKTRYAATME